MPDNMSDAVEKLRTSTHRLNTICDAAAQVVRDVEAFLEESHVGVSAWVNVKEIDDGRQSVSLTLSYSRHTSGKFRIVINRIPSWAEEPDDVTTRAWSECSRDEKLDSFEKLPELLVELSKQVDERTAKAERTVATVSSLLQLPKKRKGGA